MSWHSECKNFVAQVDHSNPALQRLMGYWTFFLLLLALLAFLNRALLLTMVLVTIVCLVAITALLRPQFFRFVQKPSYTIWFALTIAWKRCQQLLTQKKVASLVQRIKKCVLRKPADSTIHSNHSEHPH